jgi:Ran GTPase-activating protein (RanGAP) involved in mRNA processing and transport
MNLAPTPTSRVARSAGRSEFLADVLERCKTAVELNLWDYNLGDEGAKKLAEAVKESGTMTTLGLSWNAICAEGAKALAEAVKESKTMATLDLNSNYIGDEGAKALAEALAKSKTMEMLNLTNNDLGHEGAKALVEAIETSGREIRVYANSVDFDDMFLLARLRVRVRNGVLEFVSGAPLGGPVHRFVDRDGDHAVLARALRMLL